MEQDSFAALGMMPQSPLHPILVEWLAAHNFPPDSHLGVGYTMPVEDEEPLPSLGREILQLTVDKPAKDGDEKTFLGVDKWTIPGLRQLFRGQATPPTNKEEIQKYFFPFIVCVEKSLLTWCAANETTPTDHELKNVFSLLRRLPDSKSQGKLHDALWGICAFALTQHALSEAEFATAIGRLVQSATTFSIGPVSRNMITQLNRIYR